MSSLYIELSRVDVKIKGNFFVVVQLDQMTFPDGTKISQKYRTEIDADTEFPQFYKSNFEFNNIDLGNRITIRFGLFNTTVSNFNVNNNHLFDKSELIGSNYNTFTTSFIEMLRKHKYVENDLLLKHPIECNESGHIFYRTILSNKSNDMKIYDDNKEIEEIFYDPFENDTRKIRENLKYVIIHNEEKQFKLSKMYKKLDDVNIKLKKLAIDKNLLLQEKEKVENENTNLKKHLNKLQNFDEIHIEIDLLSQSNQGISIIEKKYAVLASQISIQKEIRSRLEDENLQIEPIMSKIRVTKDKIKEYKDANNELHFNMKRHEDMLPLISIYEEKIRTNEKIINNIKESIKGLIEKNPKIEIKEKLNQNYRDKKLLEEKLIQLNLYKDIYDEDNDLYFSRIIGSDPIMNKINKEREDYLIKFYTNKKEELKNVIEGLTRDIETFDKKERERISRNIFVDPNLKLKKVEVIAKIENIEKREKAFTEEV